MKPLAAKTWEATQRRIAALAERDALSPVEQQLALAEAQVLYGVAVMDYMMYHHDDQVRSVGRDGTTRYEIADSAEFVAVGEMNNYSPMRRIDGDNGLMPLVPMYYFLVNRVQYADPVLNFKFKSDGEGYIYEMSSPYARARQRLVRSYEGIRQLLGTDHNTLLAQLCAYQDMKSRFNAWRLNEENSPQNLVDSTYTDPVREQSEDRWETVSNLFPHYQTSFLNPYLRHCAETYRDERMAQTELTWALPEGEAADLIRQLVVRNPGRYLLIDFWAMGCGPCRAAIQSSKELRQEIGKRDDIALVFIAQERDSVGSSTYRNYVVQWLADEQTLCVPPSTFARLQELFHFSSIPHYETLTPEGRVVREDLRIDGFYNFQYDHLQRLKNKLKK